MSADKIASLQIEIDSTSEGVSSGLQSLIGTLEKLKTATKGGVGLTSVAKQLSSVNSAVNGMGSMSKLNEMITSLRNLSGVKISATIGSNITSISTALNSLQINGDVGEKIGTLVEKLRPLSELPKSNLSSYVTPLKSIPDTFKALSSIDMGAFATKMREVAKAVKPLADQMGKISKGFSSMPGQLQKLTSSTKGLTAANEKASKSYVNIYAKLMMAYRAIRAIASVIAKCIQKSNEYVENLNLFTVSMGEFAAEAKAYAEQLSDLMGIDPSDWMRNQGLFMTLATGFGVVSDRAYTMSTQLTQLGYDLSSFFNISVEEAMQKLQSGLSGELEPLRRLGYDLSQARLEAVALSLGIDKSVSSMTQAEKAELRYYAIMTQVTDAQGDFSRTLSAPSNQLRILKSEIAQCGRAIGNIFIPVLNAVLPYIIAVFKVIRGLADEIARLFGFELPEIDYSGVSSVAGGAEELSESMDKATESAKELKKHTMGFDELNVIDTTAGSGAGADEYNGNGFDFELPTYDFIGEATENRVNEIVGKIQGLLKNNILTEWALSLDFSSVEQSFGELMGATGEFAMALGGLINDTLSTVILPLSTWLIEDVTPEIFNVLTNALNILTPLVTSVTEGLKGLWEICQPLIQWVQNFVIWVLGLVNQLLVEIGTTISEKAPLITDIITGLGEIVMAVWSLVQPVLDFLISVLTPVIEGAITIIGDVLGGAIELIYGLVEFVAGVFTGDWSRAWDGICTAVSAVWDIIVSILSPIGTWLYENVIKPIWDAIMSVWTPVAEWFNTYVITPLCTFFSGLWESISGFASDCWNAIVNFFSPAIEWFSDLFDGVKQTLSDIFYNIGVIASGCWDIIVAVWGIACDFFKDLWESISGFASDCWNGIVNVWNAVSTWFDEKIISPISDAFSEFWESLKGWATDCWEGIKSVFSKVGEFFSDTFGGAWEGIIKVFSIAGDIFNDIKDGVVSVFCTVVNGLINGINKVVKIPFDAINGVLKWLRDIEIVGIEPFKGIKLINVPQIPEIQLKAAGGMVNTGEMFIAREAGPELVGTIGRKTAVVNNEQIVESIATGVADANGEQSMLLREQNSLLKALLDKETGMYIDGRKLSKELDRVNKGKGVSIIAGGAY